MAETSSNSSRGSFNGSPMPSSRQSSPSSRSSSSSKRSGSSSLYSSSASSDYCSSSESSDNCSSSGECSNSPSSPSPTHSSLSSPSPIASSNSPSSLSPTNSSASGSSGHPCPCGDEILRRRDGEFSWDPVTDLNRNVLPGEQINLKIDCDEYELTEIQWELPGKVFKDYPVTNDAQSHTAVKVDLSEDDKKQRSITFYWADTGNNRKVSLSFKANGVPCKKDCLLNVLKPTWTFVVTDFGTTRFSASNDAIGLYNSNGVAPGIKFKGRVTIPSGFGTGRWIFVQLVKPTGFIVKNADNTCAALIQNGQTVLDQGFPYYPAQFPAFPTGSNDQVPEDTPAVPLEDHLAVKSKWEFQMYILFQPAPSHSRWVPLARILWDYSFCASQGTSGWSSIAFKNQHKSDATESTDHPEWSDIIKPDDETVECPSPFCG